MTISLLGVLMIIITIAVFAYIAVDKVSSGVSSSIDEGSAYDKLAVLKAEYTALKAQYDRLKAENGAVTDEEIRSEYINTELELLRAESAISNVESALSANKPPDEIEKRLNIAKTQVEKAKESLRRLRMLY